MLILFSFTIYSNKEGNLCTIFFAAVRPTDVQVKAPPPATPPKPKMSPITNANGELDEETIRRNIELLKLNKKKKSTPKQDTRFDKCLPLLIYKC